MSTSLIPERPLIISPTLAATIGLQEAVLLHVLGELISHQQGSIEQQLKWVEIPGARLHRRVPFWTEAEVARLLENLLGLGVIVRRSDTGLPDSYYYAINEKVAEASGVEKPVDNTERGESNPAKRIFNTVTGASYIEADWQPGVDWVLKCRQHDIPEDFILGLVPVFVAYWQDRGSAEFSWGNKFYKHVLREWRHEQTRQGAWENTSRMSADWWPSPDALEILENAGINRVFVEDAVPEFVLYWRERGVVVSAWNSKFIEHIRRQWDRYSSSIGFDDVPRPIADNWQPSADCFDILQLAEIDEDYARSKVPEFILYWKDSQQARPSWNTVFLQYIKQEWARQLRPLEMSSGNAQTRSLVEDSKQRLEEKLRRFADRSWAE
jgi:hypothetical protein